MDGTGDTGMSHDEADRQIEAAAQLAARSRRSDKRWKFGLSILVLILVLATSAASAWAVVSLQQRQDLAAQLAAACSSGQVVSNSSGLNLCGKAEAIAGPQGPAGPPPAQFAFTFAGRSYVCLPDPPGSATFTCSAE